MCLAAFTVWFIACVPFGAWPGGSVHVFLEQWYKALLIFFMAAGMLTTLPQANRLFHVIAYATGVLGVLDVAQERPNRRRPPHSRRTLGTQTPTIWHGRLLIGLTFVGFMFLRGTRIQKVIAVADGTAGTADHLPYRFAGRCYGRCASVLPDHFSVQALDADPAAGAYLPSSFWRS